MYFLPHHLHRAVTTLPQTETYTKTGTISLRLADAKLPTIPEQCLHSRFFGKRAFLRTNPVCNQFNLQFSVLFSAVRAYPLIEHTYSQQKIANFVKETLMGDVTRLENCPFMKCIRHTRSCAFFFGCLLSLNKMQHQQPKRHKASLKLGSCVRF